MSNCNLAALRRTLAAGFGLAALLAIVSPVTLSAQATVYYACYVPSSGTVYRIKEPTLPTECGTSRKNGVTVQHVEFSWTDGQSASSDHGALTGLGDDDHPQYLLADGVRSSTNGLAITGTVGQGALLVSGPGPRLLWYPGKAAFRAGAAAGSEWDDGVIGLYSTALGKFARASGDFSFSVNSIATGHGSVALGVSAGATGSNAVAIGPSSVASGASAFAIGGAVEASGDYSQAFGYHAGTHGKTGAIVFGDHTSSFDVRAAADNQFVVRAQRFWLGTNNNVTATAGRFIETSTGAFLSSGGTWTNSSDVNRKTAFEDINSAEVLTKLASLPIRTWSYKDEDASVRHIGPTAQDFSAAFGFGGTDKAIATVDADGVSLVAIQALEKRLRVLMERIEKLERSVR